MKSKFLLISSIFLLLFTGHFAGCSSIEKTVTVGLLTGAVSGAVITPGIVKQNKKDALVIGALVGAALGGVAGYFTHKKLDERDEKIRKDTIFNLENFGYHPTIAIPNNKDKDAPPVMNPKVEKIWIEPRIEGHKYISGHYQWVITDEARWGNKSEDKKESKGDDKKEQQVQKDQLEQKQQENKNEQN
ncbi:MAG: hypothetical protein HQK49_22620 [Oligoflexia bacterium]|nr:hypothetical protein [Oligoflexia bacterium]